MRRRISSQKHKSYGFAFTAILLLLLLSLPFVILSFKADESTDTRSDAKENETTNETAVVPIQSWIVTPNDNEIVYSDTPVRFFARAANTPDAKFIFSVDLYKGQDMNYIDTLFTTTPDTNLSSKEDIYSKNVDFSRFPESNDYRLKLTTTLALNSSSDRQTNTKIDFSDRFFTISSNDSKPVFKSFPQNTNLLVGQQFSYNVQVQDTSQVKLKIAAKPDWLKASNNTLQGTPTTAGIDPVVIIATNQYGRQTSQAFSINIKAPEKQETPSEANKPHQEQNNQTSPEDTQPNKQPTQSPNQDQGSSGKENVGDSESEGQSVIVINTPPGDQITKENSRISIDLPAEQEERFESLLVEISSDGVNWEKVYEGEDTEFELDVDSLDSGGEYFLRFRTRYDDGSEDIKNYGPVDVIKESDETDSEVLTIIEVQPQEGEEISTRKPNIGGTFRKSSPDVTVDLNSFNIILNDEDITSLVNTINEFGFSYVPENALENGEYNVKVEIAAENASPITKEWNFSILSEDAQESGENESEDENLSRNRTLLLILCIIVFLILLLSIAAFLLSRKDKETVYTETVYEGKQKK